MGWGFYSHQMVSNQHFDEASGLSIASGVASALTNGEHGQTVYPKVA
jgi:hypothetical protein